LCEFVVGREKDMASMASMAVARCTARPPLALTSWRYTAALRWTSTEAATDDASTSAARRRRRAMLDKFLRVDHAGEFGANRIYAGQEAVLGRDKHTGPLIRHMWEQEKVHLATFDRLLPQYRARPTALLPLWHLAGFALGAGTAALGKEAAMACTVAVEASITEHYNDQLRALIEDDPELHKELIEIITKFRDEEQEHHDIGLEEDAEQAPAYEALTAVIKVGCKGAIWLSERI
jgi:ubiquinone biosynthesis monooxygenase Coq7